MLQGGLLPMLVTAGGAVWVYYVVSVQKGYPDSLGMAAGIFAAVLLAAFFTRLGPKGKAKPRPRRPQGRAPVPKTKRKGARKKFMPPEK
ncbi:MAG: hypothetical protein ACPLRH_06880 [Desulfotomaculales bacterium]